MYLIEISQYTGLVKDEVVLDGWKGILAFKEIVNDPKLGLECLTAIAYAVDYASPIRYYPIQDRPKKAMDLVTGNRNAFDWNQDKIQVAMNVYNELQFNPSLQEKLMLDELRLQKLKEIEQEKDDNIKKELFKDLKEINSLIKEFKKYHEEYDLYDSSPTRSGYKLTRLEQKLLNKKSFYYDNKKENSKGN